MTIAALIVGDDDLGELGRQVVGLRDHPDAGFRSVRAGDDAADIVAVDRDGAGGLLRPHAAIGATAANAASAATATPKYNACLIFMSCSQTSKAGPMGPP